MTLTKTQKEIIRLMREGWELGKSGGIYPRVWLQDGGLGKGGKTMDCRISTLLSLLDKEVIIKNNSDDRIWLATAYTLTEKGRTVNID